MGFPILKLPVVALKVLVNHLNEVELLTVSLLSRRADWFLKICGKKNVSFFNSQYFEIRYLYQIQILQFFLLEHKRQGELPDWNFNLCCVMGGRYSEELLRISCNMFNVPIHFDDLKIYEKADGFRRYLKIGESLVPVNIVYNRIHTVWEDKIDGLIQLLSYFKNELNLSIERLELPGEDIEAMEKVINHINSSQIIVKNVLVERYPQLPDYCGEFILENLSATEKFYFNSKLGEAFEFNEGIRAKTIKIRFGHWFTIENILMSNESEVIHVKGSNYTKIELRWFLSKWRTGKLPKLKEVTLSTRVSAREVVRGFERWEARCGKCGSGDMSIILIKGYGGFHGSVNASRDCFHMSIHSNR